LDSRVKYRDDLFESVAVQLRKRTTAEWLLEFEREDIICAPVANYADVTQSEQFAGSNSTVRFTHPVAGDIEVIGPMRTCISEDGPVHKFKAPPRLGEHTQEVLEELVSEKISFA
jgi:crotonobetainyl-CoA:carnitine CoA-transferase CaiB-like acyl-CoA transferase